MISSSTSDSASSMFSRATDASKVALAHLVARLKRSGFVLLDTQFVTDHLERMGAIEISRAAYQVALEQAIGRHADFWRQPIDTPPHSVLQLRTQTS